MAIPKLHKHNLPANFFAFFCGKSRHQRQFQLPLAVRGADEDPFGVGVDPRKPRRTLRPIRCSHACKPLGGHELELAQKGVQIVFGDEDGGKHSKWVKCKQTLKFSAFISFFHRFRS